MFKHALAGAAIAAAAVLAAPADAQTTAFNYATQVQWGGSTAPWRDNGVFVIRNSDSAPLQMIKAISKDGGRTLTGAIMFGTSGPVDFRAVNVSRNTYEAQTRFGGETGTWENAGVFVLGGRDRQRLVELNALGSKDGGKTLAGMMKYQGEGPIGFRATLK